MASPPTTPRPWKRYAIALFLIAAASLLLPWFVLSRLKPLPAVQQPTAASAAVGAAIPAPGTETQKCETLAYDTKGIRFVWLGVLGLMGLFVLVAGHGITGLWRGAFIDVSNKISLSRFQMILWTILLLSAFLVTALINIERGQPNPIDIRLDETLWLLMGISTTSLVGSPLIKTTKRKAATGAGPGSPPTSTEARTYELLEEQGKDTTKLERDGNLLVNKDPRDASWADMFSGETVADAAHLDLGKIQMFYFTIIIAFAYGTQLANMFMSDRCGITEFPILSGGTVALLGISHAGYLVNKGSSAGP